MKKIFVYLATASLICASCSHKTVSEDSSVAMGYPSSTEDSYGKPTTLPMNPPVRIMDVPADTTGKPTTLPMNPPVRIMDVPADTTGHQNHAVTLPMREPVKVAPVPSATIPKATAFRMNGDYQNNVAVTLGPDGNLIYFPDPSDITADSEPVSLGNGWWLNNQGIGQNSVFTKYTFAEYAELPSPPTPQQLKNAIIPGSGVIQMVQLPYNVSQAPEHISEIKEFLNNY